MMMIKNSIILLFLLLNISCEQVKESNLENKNNSKQVDTDTLVHLDNDNGYESDDLDKVKESSDPCHNDYFIFKHLEECSLYDTHMISEYLGGLVFNKEKCYRQSILLELIDTSACFQASILSMFTDLVVVNSKHKLLIKDRLDNVLFVVDTLPFRKKLFKTLIQNNIFEGVYIFWEERPTPDISIIDSLFSKTKESANIYKKLEMAAVYHNYGMYLKRDSLLNSAFPVNHKTEVDKVKILGMFENEKVDFETFNETVYYP